MSAPAFTGAEPRPQLPLLGGAAPEAVYDYTDESGRLLYVQARYPGKEFLPYRLNGGGWRAGLGDGRRVLYRLPAVAAHLSDGRPEPIRITEGEKDADALAALGETATCAFGGTGAAVEQYAEEYLRGARHVIVHADNDEPGRALARRWLAALGPYVDAVEAVLPALDQPKADVADHLAGGHGLGEFVPLPAAAEEGDAPAPPKYVTAAEFARGSAEDERLRVLLGTQGDALLVGGGLHLLAGPDGGTKSTLSIDLAAHLAAGIPWLGLPVPKPLRIIYVENEGPRTGARQRIAEKLDTWQGPAWEERVLVYENPWGVFDLTDERCRTGLMAAAAQHGEHGADLVIAGPLLGIGATGEGRPSDTTALVSLLRRECGLWAGLAWLFIHHLNVVGEVSGDWKRHADTVLRAEREGVSGRTKLSFPKPPRWAYPREPMHLAWVEASRGFVPVEVQPPATAEEVRERALAWLQANEGWHATEAVRRNVKGPDALILGALFALFEGGEIALSVGVAGKPVERPGVGTDAEYRRQGLRRYWKAHSDAGLQSALPLTPSDAERAALPWETGVVGAVGAAPEGGGAAPDADLRPRAGNAGRHLLGDESYPLLLAEAVKGGHVVHAEAAEAYALHRLVVLARAVPVPAFTGEEPGA